MSSLNNFFLLLLLLVLLPSALAMTLTTDKANYVLGDTVSIVGSCKDISTAVIFEGLLVKDPLSDKVWFDQKIVTNFIFSTSFKPAVEGKYLIYAACSGESKSVNFCLGSNCGKPPEDQPKDSDSPGSSSGGGPPSCTPAFECTVWSYCNASLKQTRTCTDTNYCKPYYVNVTNCTQCDESWTCSIWSACKYGTQERTCTDLHACGTTKLKPPEQKGCQEWVAPVQQQQQYIPPPPQQEQGFVPQVAQVVTEKTKSAWENYKYYIIGAAAFVILALIAVILILVLRKPKQVYNLDELRTWVQQERQMGTSDADIRTILVQSTGWKEPEISRALGSAPVFGAQPSA